jgi:AcrR family transcriptional regulator
MGLVSPPSQAQPANPPPDTDEWEIKRHRIMESAADAFLLRGFEGANLEDVAIAAGVGKATIYRLFLDKADLFAAVVLESVRRMAAPLRETLRPDRPIEHVLIGFAELYVDRMTAPFAGSYPFYEMMRLLVGTSRTQPLLARKCVAIFRRDLGEPLAAYFRSKSAAGELVEEDADFLAEHFTQLLFFTNRFAIDPGSLPSQAALRQRAVRSVRLFLRGCGRAAG